MKLKNLFLKPAAGSLYFVDKTELLSKSIASIRDSQEPSYPLKDGIILLNDPHDNKRIRFDFLGDSEYYGGTCNGFLYSDSKFIGQINYMVEANLPPEHIKGVYKLTKHKVIIHGEWEGSKDDKSFFWLELSDQY